MYFTFCGSSGAQTVKRISMYWQMLFIFLHNLRPWLMLCVMRWSLVCCLPLWMLSSTFMIHLHMHQLKLNWPTCLILPAALATFACRRSHFRLIWQPHRGFMLTWTITWLYVPCWIELCNVFQVVTVAVELWSMYISILIHVLCDDGFGPAIFRPNIQQGRGKNVFSLYIPFTCWHQLLRVTGVLFVAIVTSSCSRHPTVSLCVHNFKKGLWKC